MGTEAELGQALSWTEPVAQTFWTLAYPLGLMKTRLRFFHSRRNREETLGTWSQSFISTPINLTATLHPLVRVAWETLFLRLCGRAPFPSDSVRTELDCGTPNWCIRALLGGLHFGIKCTILTTREV